MERNETIALANVVNDRLKEVDNEIAKVNDALNATQEVINASSPGKTREALQTTVNGQREI